MPCDKACHFRTGRPFKKTHPAGISIDGEFSLLSDKHVSIQK